MRQRTTWKQTPRSASTQRRADDLYTMNRDGGNPQPAVNEYETGDPSTWAEDVNSGSSVEKEYQGGAVKRNEIGQPEFRDDTWNHAGTRPWGKGGQYDNAKLAAQKKAAACEQVARAILRTNDKNLVAATASDLMNLPAKSLVATLRRMSQTSPASLPEESRFRRALACTKLAAIILSENAEEQAIERLASTLNSIDDPTLKQILSLVAAHRVAEEEKEEEKEISAAEKCSEEEKEEEKEEKDDEKEEEEEDEEEGVLTQSDLDKLKSLMEDVVEKEGDEKGGDTDDLENLFEEEGAGAPPPPVGGSSPIDISFDGDEEDTEGKPAMASDLNGLFDTEENLAQRELIATQSNFSRTASTKGAKKLGQVRVAKNVDDSLENLWDRPGQQ